MKHCSFCKSPIPKGKSQRWHSSEGDSLDVETTSMASALAETSVGVLTVCENCYRKELPSFLTDRDCAEIHQQFGMDYVSRGQFGLGVESFQKALVLSETADNLASLAHALNELGRQEEAAAAYRKALELDPSHFISYQNLKRMEGRSG